MATKAKKPQDKYKPNTFVVHPHHGAAKGTLGVFAGFWWRG